MSKPCSGLFYGTVGERTKSHAASRVRTPRQKTKNVDPNNIRFSQTSVNGSNEIAESMKKNGWQGAPIDIVLMDDGELTTLDNTRVVAARTAGISTKANVHNYNDPLPDQATKDRFTTPKGGEPQTWGEAVKNRIGKQSSHFKRSNPYGSYNMEKIN